MGSVQRAQSALHRIWLSMVINAVVVSVSNCRTPAAEGSAPRETTQATLAWIESLPSIDKQDNRHAVSVLFHPHLAIDGQKWTSQDGYGCSAAAAACTWALAAVLPSGSRPGPPACRSTLRCWPSTSTGWPMGSCRPGCAFAPSSPSRTWSPALRGDAWRTDGFSSWAEAPLAVDPLSGFTLIFWIALESHPSDREVPVAELSPSSLVQQATADAGFDHADRHIRPLGFPGQHDGRPAAGQGGRALSAATAGCRWPCAPTRPRAR